MLFLSCRELSKVLYNIMRLSQQFWDLQTEATPLHFFLWYVQNNIMFLCSNLMKDNYRSFCVN